MPKYKTPYVQCELIDEEAEGDLARTTTKSLKPGGGGEKKPCMCYSQVFL
jgi:hypothetical protein